jgi:UDP-N-acetylglucosamine acyltransferase
VPVDIHPTAIIDSSAQLGVDVSIGPYCVIAGRVGDGCRLRSHVVIEPGCDLGAHGEVHPFACLGGAPQDRKHRGEPSQLIIGPRAIIREHATAHGGTAQGGGATRIGADALLMVGVHVAHDCRLGDGVVLANQVALGGHVVVGDYAMIGGLTGVHQFVRIGQNAAIGGASAIRRDVPPYCLARGPDGALRGLNLVGLRRMGVAREALTALRSLYRLLEATGAPLQARLPDAVSDGPAAVLLKFLRESSRRGIARPEDRTHDA